ncbi:MAG: glycerophosphodiester phosphodiesterase family protein [Clostridia bacterium]
MRLALRKFYFKHKKFATTISIILTVIILILAFFLSTFIPKAPDTNYNSEVSQNNQYIQEQTMVSAHRAGATIAPENTMKSFKTCFENNNSYKVDILEFDLHITKDNKLILLHDDTLDRTSDCVEVYNEKNVKPENYTYAELLKYNLGYNFIDENGNYPYREEDIDLTDCKVVSLDNVFTYIQTIVTGIWHTDLKYIIEIKNGGELGLKATDILVETIKSYNLLDSVIIGTFQGEVTQYLDKKYPEVTRSSSVSEVLDFYFSCMFNVDLTKKDIKYKVLQIPDDDFVINFGKKSIVDYAHKYGIAVQYWTINKEKDIKHLQEIGADAIMSDNPELAYKVLNNLD